jgi:hypothetical protein
MSSRPFVNDIFNSPEANAKWIDIYTGKEVSQDPYENNVVVTYNNPLSIKALVTDLSATQALYKMPGIEVSKIKEIFIKTKYRSLIEMSQKIGIQGDMYEGWRVNGKMQIREMAGDILRVYIYIKVV